jgi:hypothetical protein
MALQANPASISGAASNESAAAAQADYAELSGHCVLLNITAQPATVEVNLGGAGGPPNWVPARRADTGAALTAFGSTGVFPIHAGANGLRFTAGAGGLIPTRRHA